VGQLVHQLAVRRLTPPRRVEVHRDGHWWPGFQHAWRLCDDGRGWMADVDYVVAYDWGRGKHMGCVPPERLRLPGSEVVATQLLLACYLVVTKWQ